MRARISAPQEIPHEPYGHRSAIRLEPDQVMVDIADYVIDYQIQSSEAFATARYMLLDSLGCAMLAMKHPDASSTSARWCPAPACPAA
jgi:2-methylcitrate dehydratase